MKYKNFSIIYYNNGGIHISMTQNTYSLIGRNTYMAVIFWQPTCLTIFVEIPESVGIFRPCLTVLLVLSALSFQYLDPLLQFFMGLCSAHGHTLQSRPSPPLTNRFFRCVLLQERKTPNP
jgi:hypothetical protein